MRYFFWLQYYSYFACWTVWESGRTAQSKPDGINLPEMKMFPIWKALFTDSLLPDWLHLNEMKTGNDLVAEQVHYSTRFCSLPNCAKQCNIVVLQRIAFWLLYFSIGCIDSFLSLHRTCLYRCSRAYARQYPQVLWRQPLDNDKAAKDQYGRECSLAGYSQDDFEEVQGQITERQDTSHYQQSEAKCVLERDCRCMRD